MNERPDPLTYPYVNCEMVEARVTSKADRGLVRTSNTVTNAAGVTLMVYRPLRLMKMRGSEKQT